MARQSSARALRAGAVKSKQMMKPDDLHVIG
jgi:hypothetical protein